MKDNYRVRKILAKNLKVGDIFTYGNYKQKKREKMGIIGGVFDPPFNEMINVMKEIKNGSIYYSFNIQGMDLINKENFQNFIEKYQTVYVYNRDRKVRK